MNEKLIILALAFLIDACLGDAPNAVHPVAAMGFYVQSFAKSVASESNWRLLLNGIAWIVIGILIFASLPVGLTTLLEPYPLISILIQAILLKSVFSLRSLLFAGALVEQELATGSLEAAREAVARHLVSRPVDGLGEGHVASAAVESLAENFCDSVLAPLLMFLIGGLPLAWAYRFANTADAIIGYRDGRYEYLGKFAARLDDALNWVPARLSALIIVVSSFLSEVVDSTVSGKNAWKTMRRQHASTASPNAGWTMSATAGALGVILEKTGFYRLEGGERLPDARSIVVARKLIFVSSVVWAICCLVICI